MGLIACFIGPLIAGASVAWLSPFEWVAAPQTLLDVVARFRATHAWLPNFALLFLAQRAKRPADLSSLRHVVNCSEVVTAEALDVFATRFASDGFDRAALASCYAMAENVYAVTSTTREDPPRVRTVGTAQWREQHVAALAPADAAPETTLLHASSGRALPGVEVRIVGADGVASLPLHAGRVLVRSPFLFAGYHRRDDLNSALFDQAGFFDTGDVGYCDEIGHLYVTGRAKDVMIVAGKNVYPQDIENVVDSVEGIHPGRAVAFGVSMPRTGTDGIVVLAESDEEDREVVAQRIRARIAAVLDLDVVDVRALARQSLRKSTSGKLARSGNRDWYLEGRFGEVAEGLLAGGDV
jgi:acyl-CoA synthetase (AMP-forming)/AMP-acid ligase II